MYSVLSSFIHQRTPSLHGNTQECPFSVVRSGPVVGRKERSIVGGGGRSFGGEKRYRTSYPWERRGGVQKPLQQAWKSVRWWHERHGETGPECSAVFLAYDGDTGLVVKGRCLFGQSQGGQRSSHHSHGQPFQPQWTTSRGDPCLFAVVELWWRFGEAAKRLGET